MDTENITGSFLEDVTCKDCVLLGGGGGGGGVCALNLSKMVSRLLAFTLSESP